MATEQILAEQVVYHRHLDLNSGVAPATTMR